MSLIPYSHSPPTPQYFHPPTSPFWASLHQTLLPLVTEGDYIISGIQRFFGVRYRGRIFSSTKNQQILSSTLSTSSSSNNNKTSIQSDIELLQSQLNDPLNHSHHPLYSPFRAILPLHILFCIASELGNELFYGLWVALTICTWDLHTALPLLLLWSLSLGLTQLVKDKAHLPRPGCQYYNPLSIKYYQQPIPIHSYIFKLESHYAAEYGFPSAHCAGSILALYNLYALYTKYTIIPDSALSTIIYHIVQFSCLFWLIMTPISRLYCGVHSIVDIIGGLLVSLACMIFVIFLEYTNVTSFLFNTTIGIIILGIAMILLCVFYPKHDHMWVNSSGDSALVLGTAYGGCITGFIFKSIADIKYNSVTSFFDSHGTYSITTLIHYILSIPTLTTSCMNTLSTINIEPIYLFFKRPTTMNTVSTLIQSCPNVLNSFMSYPPITQLSTLSLSPNTNHFFTSSVHQPIPYSLISPTFLFPVENPHNSSFYQLFSNHNNVLLSAFGGIFLIFLQGSVTLVLSYITKDLVLRKPVFKLTRSLLGYPASPPPLIQSNQQISTSSKTIQPQQKALSLIATQPSFEPNPSVNDHCGLQEISRSLPSTPHPSEHIPIHTSSSTTPTPIVHNNASFSNHYGEQQSQLRQRTVQSNQSFPNTLESKLELQHNPSQQSEQSVLVIQPNTSTYSNNTNQSTLLDSSSSFNTTTHNSSTFTDSTPTLSIDSSESIFEDLGSTKSNYNQQQQQQQQQQRYQPKQTSKNKFEQVDQTGIEYAGPPKTSTLYKYSHDMSIKDTNVLDMVDKFIGYFSLPLMVFFIYTPIWEYFGLQAILYSP